MSCDEVDARVGASSVALVEVARAAETVCELGDLALVASPESSYRVPVLSVPFRPETGKVAHLVAPLPEVPGLRDQLDLRDHGILLDHF